MARRGQGASNERTARSTSKQVLQIHELGAIGVASWRKNGWLFRGRPSFTSVHTPHA